MITLQGLVDDLELRFTSAKPSQDFEVPKSQMAAWIDVARDEVTRYLIDNDKKIDESVLLTVTGSQGDVSYDGATQKISYTLPYLPLDTMKVNPIVMVYTNNGFDFLHVSKASSFDVRKMSFTKPSACNYQYYRENDKLILAGPDAGTVGTMVLNVSLVVAETQRVKTFSEKYYIMPSSVKAVLDMAEEIGWREINQGIYDVTNDGTQNDAK